MTSFIQRALQASKKFTVMDFALLKITLIAFGILLGTYLWSFFSHHIGWLWVIFLLSYIWIMYRTFVTHWR